MCLIVRLFLLFAPAFAECLGDNPLQLPVDATKLVSCPLFEGVHRLSIYAQYKAFGICGIFRHIFCFYVNRLPSTAYRLLIVCR